MKAERIDHVTVYVKDLDKAITFFADLFGSVFSAPFGPEREDVTEVMDQLGLNLMASKTERGPIARFIRRRGEGLAGLTFKVPSIEDAISEMQCRNIRLLNRGDYGKDAKWATFHPKDTLGVLINLVEYHPLQPYLSCFDKPPKLAVSGGRPEKANPAKERFKGENHRTNRRKTAVTGRLRREYQKRRRAGKSLDDAIRVEQS